jgi:UDP-4-amino-4,6-dideoxy-N-acetyl-beta-L-altrosamine N-acetyltransferase
MYSQHEITLAEHLAWFDSATLNPLRHLLIYQEDNQPLGYVNITQHSSKQIADWGFYLSPEAPKGSGSRLGKAALKYAFTSLSLHKICGEALDYNQRSINFHLNQGFKQEGVLRDQYFDGEEFHSIVCFGLLKQEWHSQQKEATHG